MKKIMLVIGILVLLVGQVWGATYYAAKIDAQWKYLQDAWPTVDTGTNSDDINGIIFSVGDNNTTVLSGGVSGETYSGTDLDSADGIDIGRENITLRAANSADPDYASHSGQITLDGTGIGDSVIAISSTVLASTIEGIIITGADSGYFAVNSEGGDNGVVLNDMILSGGAMGLSVTEVAILNRCVIEDMESYPIDMFADVGAQLTINYSVLRLNPGSIRLAKGTITANHSLFSGFDGEALEQITADGAVSSFTNCIISGNSITNSEETLTNTSNGTMTVSHSVLLPDGKSGDNRTWTGLTDGGNNIYELSNVINLRRPCVISLVIDDSGNRALWDLVAQYATTKNIPVVFACDHQSTIEETDAADPLGTGWESLRERVAEGHEIASHALFHVNLGTLSQEDLETHLNNSKSLIEVGIGGGYVCDTIIYPGGDFGVDETNKQRVTDTCRDSGYPIGRAISNTESNRFLDDYLIYRTMGLPLSDRIGKTNIKRNISAAIAQALSAGGMWTFYAHGDDGTYGDDSIPNDYLLANWQTLLDAIADMGAQGYFKTLSGAAAYIIANGTDADEDQKRWTRSFSDDSNYRLRTVSPCINTGADVPALYGAPDFYNDYMYRKHDIGVSEKAGAPKGGSRILRIGGGMGF